MDRRYLCLALHAGILTLLLILLLVAASSQTQDFVVERIGQASFSGLFMIITSLVHL
ncbi:hypothetical protein DEU56DRAFT_819946 [Suillus clintonianus]|uniref:uncharacterized protein n=1 Tax=Suillus clintonianus TaxID=1904413 RepID=UPI001B85DF11|nr:uncharacterized protein DEU56DRAFT_819946 [Suillus clintonianus]KAG2127677.1 hypothetical protein DEU56DRAFT_819946 [Suillus clintonianus]